MSDDIARQIQNWVEDEDGRTVTFTYDRAVGMWYTNVQIVNRCQYEAYYDTLDIAQNSALISCKTFDRTFTEPREI